VSGVERGDIARLIPHQGAMSLLERVAHWDAVSIVALSATHRSPSHPLRSNELLRAIHLCEYGAQAAALHGGLLARCAGGVAAPGYLVSLRDVALHCQRIDDLPGELTIQAELLLQDSGSWQYRFTASHAGTCLAAGRLAIMRRPVSGAGWSGQVR
jgi:predicted hotdog family 3-hydroxylacyl-ACP dehydratase